MFFYPMKNLIIPYQKLLWCKDWRKFIYGGFTNTNKKIWLKTNTLKN